MNALDIILLVILTLAAVDGWRRGVIVQVCGIAGLVLGIWLAMRFSHTMGIWLHLGETFSTILGFVVILVLSVLALGFVGFLFKRIFKLTGFGLLDNICGVILSVMKISLLFYFVTSSFARMNDSIHMIKPQIIDESKVFLTLEKATDVVFPFLIKAKDKLFATHWAESTAPEKQ